MRVKNLTRKQKALAAGQGVLPEHWWVIAESEEAIILKSKKSGQRRTIKKQT